jgi:23S rRNA (cytosine1962-C5)-methyltransferase
VSVRLNRDLTRPLAHGHPWIWADALAVRPGGLPRIDEVTDAAGGFAARGVVDPEGAIAVRVLTRAPEELVDAAFVRARLEDALALRRRVMPPATEALRLVHGEADGLPGVVVDRYVDTLVVRFDADAVRRTLGEWVLAGLGTLLSPRCIVERRPEDRGTGRLADVVLGDDPPSDLVVREGAVAVGVDVRRGQKTGLYLDQSLNHARIASWCDGATVLNLFSYTGGFGLHAAVTARAPRVTCVDSAAPVIEAARRNFARNGLEPALHRFEVADAFRWAQDARRSGVRWDVVIADPPSLAPSERVVPKALAQYRRLLEDASALVAPGGLLVASSCSSHVTESAFLGAAAAGAAGVGRTLQIVELRSAGPDHPVVPAFPEGRYLKLFVARPTASSHRNVSENPSRVDVDPKHHNSALRDDHRRLGRFLEARRRR